MEAENKGSCRAAGRARRSDGVEDRNADGEKPQRKREKWGKQTQIGRAEKEA